MLFHSISSMTQGFPTSQAASLLRKTAAASTGMRWMMASVRISDGRDELTCTPCWLRAARATDSTSYLSAVWHSLTAWVRLCQRVTSLIHDMRLGNAQVQLIEVLDWRVRRARV
jgi:hypothetical protein